MEDMIMIESLKFYPNVTAQQLKTYMEELLETESKDLLLFPDPADPGRYVATLLAKYYTPELSDIVAVRDTERVGAFQNIYMTRGGIRVFIGSFLRKLLCTQKKTSLDDLLEQVPEGEQQLAGAEKQPIPFQNTQTISAMQFLKTKTPLQIEKELNEQIIGQPALTRAVADFLYYHVLRQIHPELPPRPLLISGPSGNGKTEVWRAAGRLYGELFPIRIIDGSNISCEGWSGNFKLNTYVDSQIVKGGILVVDEFDKLAKPKHNSKGDNVSLDIQAEFLKLMEGEYRVVKERSQTDMTSQKMGIVLVGAFESLRKEKAQQQVTAPHIGFCTQEHGRSLPMQGSEPFTDEDFIRFGIMPEIVGRIAAKCTVMPLNEGAYMDIIRNPNSRVSQIEKVLKNYGAELSDVLSNEELDKLIAFSRRNHTGVRWVSAQVEARLLETIREKGLSLTQANAS